MEYLPASETIRPKFKMKDQREFKCLTLKVIRLIVLLFMLVHNNLRELKPFSEMGFTRNCQTPNKTEKGIKCEMIMCWYVLRCTCHQN